MDSENKAPHATMKARREKLGFTQQWVSNMAGIDIRLYQRLESGERQIGRASFRIGVAIADVLGLDVHELVDGPAIDEYSKEKQQNAKGD